MSSLHSELKPRRAVVLEGTGAGAGAGAGTGSVQVATVRSRGGGGMSPTSLVSTVQPTPMSLVTGRTERRLGPGLWSGLELQPLAVGCMLPGCGLAAWMLPGCRLPVRVPGLCALLCRTGSSILSTFSWEKPAAWHPKS